MERTQTGGVSSGRGEIRPSGNGRNETGLDWAAVAAEVSRAITVYLRGSFRGSLNEQDFEDLAQDALVELHRRIAAGEEIRDPRAFAKRVAWRDARDLVQKRRPVPSDPHGRLFQSVEDRAEDPEARLVGRAELARAIEAAERLSREEQLVYRTKFVEGLNVREACRDLGLTRSTYYRRLRAAVAAVEETLEPERYAALQRELLRSYVTGIGTWGERRRAKRLLASDPAAAVMARELRDLHHGAAAALPVPAIEQVGDLSAVERIGQVAASVRDRLAGLGDQSPEQIAAELSASGTGRAAGVGTGGLLAHLGLAGGAGKVAVACLGAGAVTAVCVVSGVVPGIDLRTGDVTPAKAKAERTPRTQPPNPALVREGETSPARSVTETQPKAEKSADTEAVSPAVAPSAPPVEQEFGVASATAPDSAEAPGGAASASDVQQEFGP